ncbi:Egln3 [Symbiodinium microadriaticum]|nr:Egln3 [Symbiodinium microadriaticum]
MDMLTDDDEPPGSQLVLRPGPTCVKAFERTGICVIPNFLGGGKAAGLRRASLALFADGGMAPGALGGSDGRGIQRNFRGDYVAWLGPRGVNEPTKRCRREGAVRATLRAGSKLLEDDHPFEVPSATLWTSLLGPLTTQLDMTVAALRPDLDRGEVMASVYPPDCGAQFRRHLDNPCDDGRRISAVYYVNPGWKREDGALLRCWSRHGEVEEILPIEDTLVLFEADSIEHEVTQNSSTGIFPDGYRCAFTCWPLESQELQGRLQKHMLCCLQKLVAQGELTSYQYSVRVSTLAFHGCACAWSSARSKTATHANTHRHTRYRASVCTFTDVLPESSVGLGRRGKH